MLRGRSSDRNQMRLGRRINTVVIINREFLGLELFLIKNLASVGVKSNSVQRKLRARHSSIRGTPCNRHKESSHYVVARYLVHIDMIGTFF